MFSVFMSVAGWRFSVYVLTDISKLIIIFRYMFSIISDIIT